MGLDDGGSNRINAMEDEDGQHTHVQSIRQDPIACWDVGNVGRLTANKHKQAPKAARHAPMWLLGMGFAFG